MGAVSTNEVYRLTRRAERGDASALRDLQKLNERIANNVNRRMKNLEKRSLKSPAVGYMKNYLESKGRKVLSKSKKLSPKELKQQILRGQKFLSAKTGSVKGQKEYEKKQIEQMKQYGIDLSKDRMMEKWAAFTQSSIFNEMMEFDSERTLDEGLNSLHQGRSLDELEELFEKYKNKEMELLDVWRAWTRVK